QHTDLPRVEAAEVTQRGDPVGVGPSHAGRLGPLVDKVKYWRRGPRRGGRRGGGRSGAEGPLRLSRAVDDLQARRKARARSAARGRPARRKRPSAAPPPPRQVPAAWRKPRAGEKRPPGRRSRRVPLAR